MNISKQYRTVVALLIAVGLVGTAYYLASYESPYECVLRETQNLKDRVEDTSLGSSKALYDTSDPEKVTIAVETIVDSYDFAELDSDDKQIYLALKIMLESCGVR